MRILVTGGAGYIGSQMVRQLVENKIDVVVIDSLENGHRAAIPLGVPLRVGSVGDGEFLEEVFGQTSFDAVIHFAGYISVKESMDLPNRYFRNNVTYTNRLLEAMQQFGVRHLVFSSSAAVYGNPLAVPIPEDHPRNPINPYGQSKWMVEQMLPWCEAAWGLHAISLRYFNAAGATLDGAFGEDHRGEPHIIPLALRAALEGKPFRIFGGDYPTRDGTCIRDYIHVIDLCNAHLLALHELSKGHPTAAYNVGTGHGYSNEEIVEAVRRITGIDLQVEISSRRPGDPGELVADSTRLRREFGWEPRNSDLETIIGSAWKWHRSHPGGYVDVQEGA
jgi:UDP-glucose 4-epimerase